MTIRVSAAVALALSASLSCGNAQAKPPTAAQVAQVDKLFADLAKPGLPGCVVGADKGGKPFLRKAFGQGNLETPQPIGANTVFEAASVSKQFTAAAVALLSTQGKLSLDDDIRKYVPEIPDYGTKITIRQLLNHTSGLRNWDDMSEFNGWPDYTQVFTQDYALNVIAAQRKLNFTPGTEYLYSNSNFALAAIVVARVSGLSFDQFSRKFLFEPLGMNATRWRDDFTALVPGRAQAYSQRDNGEWRLDMPFQNTVGQGGLLTTVPDLLKWNEALSRPQPANAAWVALLTQPGTLNNGRKTLYGLGLELSPINGVPAVGHSGATAGYRSYAARIPSQDLSVALLCNAGSLNTEDLGPQLVAALMDPPSAAETKPQQAPPAAAGPARVAAAIGKYRNTANATVVTVTEKAGGISFNDGAPFFPVVDNTFKNADGSREAIALTDKTGAVTAIRLTRINNADLELARIAEWSPDAAALSAFEGRYFGAEVEATVSVRVTNGALEIAGKNGALWKPKPIYADTFRDESSSWYISFTRDKRGRVDGLTFTRTRSRNIEFARLP